MNARTYVSTKLKRDPSQINTVSSLRLEIDFDFSKDVHNKCYRID